MNKQVLRFISPDNIELYNIKRGKLIFKDRIKISELLSSGGEGSKLTNTNSLNTISISNINVFIVTFFILAPKILSLSGLYQNI